MSKEIVFDDRQHRTVQKCHRSHRGDADDTLQDRSLWCCQGVLWNSVGPTLSVPTCRKGASLPFAHPDFDIFHKNIFYSDSFTIMWCNTDICGSQITMYCINLCDICLIPELQEAFQGSWQDRVIDYPQKSQSSCAWIFKRLIFRILTICVHSYWWLRTWPELT